MIGWMGTSNGVVSWLGRVAMIALLVVGLAACGGGDDEDEPVATAMPTELDTATGGSSVVVVDEGSPLPEPPANSGVATPLPGGDLASPAAASSVVVTLTDYRVNASAVSFPVGQPITIQVQNNGGEPHQFVVERKGAVGEPLEANGETARIDAIAPGASATLTWTFTEPGEYQFACHEADHYELGMVLDSIVVGS